MHDDDGGVFLFVVAVEMQLLSLSPFQKASGVFEAKMEDLKHPLSCPLYLHPQIL